MRRGSRKIKCTCCGDAPTRVGRTGRSRLWCRWKNTFNGSGGGGVSRRRRVRLEFRQRDGADCGTGRGFECVDSVCPVRPRSTR